jgi:hypothetical protein
LTDFNGEEAGFGGVVLVAGFGIAEGILEVFGVTVRLIGSVRRELPGRPVLPGLELMTWVRLVFGYAFSRRDEVFSLGGAGDRAGDRDLGRVAKRFAGLAGAVHWERLVLVLV